MTPARLSWASEYEASYWEALEDANCDIQSDEAQDYIECIYNIREEWDSDYTSHMQECDDEYAKIPGCDPSTDTPTFPSDLDEVLKYDCQEQWTSEITLHFEVIADFVSDPNTITSTIDYGCDDSLGLVSEFVACSTGSIQGNINQDGWFTATRNMNTTTERYYDGALVGITPTDKSWQIHGTIQVDLSTLTICPETHWTLQEMIDYGRENFAVSWGGCTTCPLH
jgi:hypothetical protein